MDEQCSGDLCRRQPAEGEKQFATEAEADGCIEECCDQGECRRDVTENGYPAEKSSEGDNEEKEADELGETRRARIFKLGGCSDSWANGFGEQPAIRCPLETPEGAEREYDYLQSEQNHGDPEWGHQGDYEHGGRDRRAESQAARIHLGGLRHGDCSNAEGLPEDGGVLIYQRIRHNAERVRQLSTARRRVRCVVNMFQE